VLVAARRVGSAPELGQNYGRELDAPAQAARRGIRGGTSARTKIAVLAAAVVVLAAGIVLAVTSGPH
jgi:hypothetical protein